MTSELSSLTLETRRTFPDCQVFCPRQQGYKTNTWLECFPRSPHFTPSPLPLKIAHLEQKGGDGDVDGVEEEQSYNYLETSAARSKALNLREHQGIYSSYVLLFILFYCGCSCCCCCCSCLCCISFCQISQVDKNLL